MATIGFKLVSGNPNIRDYPEASAQTFKVGDLVKLSSGQVAIASSDQSVFGVAAKDASGTTNADVPVYVITGEQVWVAQANTTTSAGHVGEDYGLSIGTAGSMAVDIADTSTTSVIIQALDSRDGAAANGRVLVRFDPDKLQGLLGS